MVTPVVEISLKLTFTIIIFQNSSDTPILLSKISIKALHSMVFEKVRKVRDIKEIEDPDIPEYRVSLERIFTWIIRELWLHGQVEKEIVLLLKLDGRPFFGESISSYLTVSRDAPVTFCNNCILYQKREQGTLKGVIVIAK